MKIISLFLISGTMAWLFSPRISADDVCHFQVTLSSLISDLTAGSVISELDGSYVTPVHWR